MRLHKGTGTCCRLHWKSTLCEYPQIPIAPTDATTNDFHKITRDKVYHLLAHGQWFSPCTPASSTTETGCHEWHDDDIPVAEILLKVALNTKNQINASRIVVNKITYKQKLTMVSWIHTYFYSHIYIQYLKTEQN